MKALKFDIFKVPLELIHPIFLIRVGQVLAHGALKYAPHNWMQGFAWSRLSGAALRHLNAFNAGEDIDPESKLPHLAHLACEVMFLLVHAELKLGTDDRKKCLPAYQNVIKEKIR